MKKRIILTLAILAIFTFIFALSISAANLITSNSDEFGTVTEVEGITTNLTDMDSRMVLKNSDGTFSTFRVYTIFPKLNWRNGMTGASFDALNSALGTEYTLTSIIRIEIVLDSEYYELDSAVFPGIKEIHFPKESKITRIYRIYNATSLEKVNIPASATTIDQNAFRDCTALKYVTFDEGCSLTTLTAEAFRGCTSLEEISLPDSITTVGGSAFNGCTSLKTIRYGANLQSFASRATTHTSVFYISSTTMKDFTGTMDSNYFGDTYTPKGATIFYTGNYDEALAFRAKSTHKDAWNGTGGLSGAALVEWDSEKEDSYYIPENPTTWTIVYGYNKCKAFYNNEHLPSQTTYEFEGEKYLSSYYKHSGCPRCLQDVPTKICDALFVNKGYSYGRDGSSFVYGISVNLSEIDKYQKEHDTTLKYGFVLLSGKIASGDIVATDGTAKNGASIVDLDDMIKNDMTIFNVKLSGIDKQSEKALELYCSAYVVDKNNVFYVGDSVTNTAVSVSYLALPTKKD
ncbi:MAG: leucine-rich repeat domain-containing protein [Clostridia bacterium]|nr:leucine-rich repeat domain-containing protein [Clostridia bacterium]